MNCPLKATLLIVAAAFGTGPARADFLYVSQSGGNIARIDIATKVQTTFDSSGIAGAGGLALDSSGNLYAANPNNNTIVKYTPGDARSVFATTGLNQPIGLAFDSSGNLYADNYSGGTIEKFTPGGIGSVFATGLLQPRGLAFDGSGNLYVTTGFMNGVVLQ